MNFNDSFINATPPSVVFRSLQSQSAPLVDHQPLIQISPGLFSTALSPFTRFDYHRSPQAVARTVVNHDQPWLQPTQSALRAPYQQQGHLQTGHPRGLGLHTVTVADLATAVTAHPDNTELMQLWTALHYSYGDELGLTSSDPIQPLHPQAHWSNIRLVVWSYTNQRLTTKGGE